MNKPRIMLVEDERVVAADIEECVKGLGYVVAGSVASGTEALRLAVRTAPDLVLMDIKLKGALDGVDVGGALHEQLRIPVVYLTAHADAEILERAKKTSPAGYVLKPFDDRTLRTAIEIALERFRREMQLIQWGERLSTALSTIDDGLVLTDATGRVMMMNKVAQKLTGRAQEDAAGKPLGDVFPLLNARTGSLQSTPVGRAMREGISVGLGQETVLLGSHGRRLPVQGSAVPVWDGETCVGACLLFRPAGGQTRDESWGGLEHKLASRLEVMGRLTAEVGKMFLELLHGDPGRGARLAARLIEFGKREPAPGCALDLNRLISGMEDLLRCALGGIGLSLTPDPEIGLVTADPGQIELLLVHLALKARESASGGQFRIRTSRRASDDAPDSYAEVAVGYTGTGWDPASDLPCLDEIATLTHNEIRVVTEGGEVKIYLPVRSSSDAPC